MFDRLFGKLGAVISLGLLGLLGSGSAWADFPSTSVFPNTGNFQARLVKDKSDIAVIELSGSYDRELADKSVNIEPRTAVAREFYRTHQDRHDFVVVFSNFEFNTGDAVAFHIGVQNQVKGLGMDTFDNSMYFGSKGKLQGYIDMAALSRYVTNPYDARFDKVLQVFAHEFLHQWGAKVRFRGADGKPSSAMLGKDDAHWSFLLNSGASVEYGNQWRDNGNGSFTSVAGNQFYSPLDLYLMGMYRKAEVPPFFLIDNPEIDRTRLPLNDVTITGARKDITIDDVIAAEGPREPDAANAQKEFHLGFVLLTRPGAPATDADIAAVNTIRRAIATRLAVLTGGRALAHSYLEAKPDADAVPGATPGSTVRDGAADLGQGMAWLRGQQAADGYWKDNPFTTMRDTAVVFDTLAELDGAGFTGRQKALAWIGAQATSNADYLARQVRAVKGAGGNADAAARRLLALQNADGGWGVAARYASNPLDTALALQALLPFEGTLAQGKLDVAAALLAAQQNSDGGWGNLAGGASRAAVSSTVLQAMKGRAGAPALAARAIAFLATRQHADGGFGESASTIHDTANAMAAMLSYNALGQIRAAQATAYISSSQQVDGSWDGSVYSTALAVRLLKSSGLFNWTATGLASQPVAPLDGQQAVLAFKVANSGTAPSPAGIARAFDGDPASGGRQVGADMNVPVLVAGDSIDLKLLWNTRDQAGTHTIVVVVDPDNTVIEASKADNRTQANVTVRDAPVPVELVVNAGDVTATPAQPNKLPSVIAISAQVANIGRSDATNVRVVLRAAGPGGAVIDEKTVNLLGRTQQVVNFSATLTRAGVASYTVTIDPDARIEEADKTNNSADVTVETVPALDVEVRDLETTIDRNPVYLGADATFTTRIRNAGTQDTPPFKVRYSISDGSRNIELASRVIQLAAGKDSSQEVAWRSDVAGQVVFKVELDPENLLAETDKTNNTTQLPVSVIEGSGINLSVAFKDFVVNPVQVQEGREVRLSQTVRNSGNVAATDVEVGFYDGDPAGGRLIGALQTIARLAPGEAATVHTSWARYPDAGDHLVFFVADPAAKLADQARDDNAAFIVLTPDSLPDLAISAGDMQVAPELPKPADPLTVSATVSNLGKQAASNVVVRAFDGDPAQGGKQVGADHVIPALAGLSAENVVFAYPASGLSGARTIVIVVDPDGKVEEKSEDNNQARRDLVAQDGNFSVTNRYFSPNGDGVKDDTTLGFRLDAATDVTVNVLATSGKLVRTIGGENLKNASTGAVVWDGLNTRGSLVPDGDYALRVVDASGKALGEAKVTLDTNRSSILKAADTPFALFTNLSCNLNSVYSSKAMFTGDEDKVFLNIMAGRSGTRDGLYSMLADGSEQSLLFSSEDVGENSGYIFFASLDGSKIAYNVEAIEDGYFKKYLWVMDGDGSNRRSLGKVGYYITIFPLTADGSAVLIVDEGRIVKIPTDGSARSDLLAYDGSVQYTDMLLSPDRKTALVTGRTSDLDATTYKMVEIASGRVSSIPAAAAAALKNGGSWSHIVWSPDAKLVVMSGVSNGDPGAPDTWNNWVFDNQFNLVKTLRYQPAQGELYRAISMTAPTWNSDSSEFAYELRYCTTAGEVCWDGGAPARLAGVQVNARARVAAEETLADGVLMVANLASGAVQLIESTRLPGASRPKQFYWVPHGRTVVRSSESYDCEGEGEDAISCTDAIDLDENGKVTGIFRDWKPSPWTGPGVIDGKMNIDGFLPVSGKMSFSSPRAATDSASACFDEGGTDQYLFSSLLNLTADLRAVRSATASGLVLRGTAADANFARYVIEYATTAAPDAWKPVAPSSGEAASDQVFLTWVPPAFGKYRLRLTVEDLAGNKRQVIRQVTWNDAPSITDLYKDTEFMSPNGDSAKEGFELHYRVAEPVHLVFNVYDMQQNLVRTVSRDHFTIGQELTFRWDGRDDRGRTVRDGQYRITVLDYEFFVTLDTVAPVAAVTLGGAYAWRENEQGEKVTAFAPQLRWAVSDANLATFVIEKGTGEVPDQWDAAYQSPAQKLVGAVMLTADQFVNQHYRALAEDKAGNKVVTEAPLGVQQVFLSTWADHSRSLKDNQWEPEYEALYPQAGKLGELPEISAGSANPLRLRFAESVRRPVAKVLVQSHLLADAEGSLPLADADTLVWEEVLVPAFLKRNGNAADFEQLGTRPRDHEIMFAWDMDGIKPETDYLVRIKVIDEDGAEFVAVAPYILRRVPSVTSLRIVKVDDARISSLVVTAELTGREPAASIDLLVQSSGDPRFSVPRVVHSTGATLGSYQHYLGADALAEFDLRLCQSYQLTLRAVMGNGEVLTSQPRNLASRCMGVEWLVKPDTPQTCDVQPAQKLRVQLVPYAEDGRKLTQLLFGQVTNGREVILNNWNNPLPKQAVEFDIDTAGMTAGTVSYFVRVINEDDKTATSSIDVPVAHGPALARITYPADGQKMCGVRMRNPANLDQFVRAVGIEAGIASDSNVSVGVEYAPAGSAEWHTFSPAEVEEKMPGFKGLRIDESRLSNPDKVPELCKYADADLCRDFHPLQWSSAKLSNFPGQPAQNGNVGYLGLAGEQIEGEVSVRLRVFNGAGQHTCTAPVTFDFDNQVRVGATVADRALFSPKAASMAKVVTFTVTPAESVTATLRLYEQVGGTAAAPVFATVSSRTLADGQQLIDGASSFEWDGNNDSGGLAADGLYQLVAEYTDSCGNVATHQVRVALDATAPAVALDAPMANGQVGLQASVTGAVRDQHFMSYVIDYAAPASPDQWFTLATRSTPTSGDAPEELAAWNTLGLAGPATLRVRADDRAGNVTTRLVPVTVVDAGNVLSYLEAVPPVFSPNADGKRDSVAIRFGLLVRGNVTLEIRRGTAEGAVVRTLMAGQLTTAGAQVKAWDGKDDQGVLQADGVYAVRASVNTVDGPAVTQEASFLVTLDTTPPQVAVTYPAGDFAPATGSVTITARDQGLASYQVWLARGANLSGWQLLGEGTEQAVNAAMLDLATLDEGQYAVKVVAQDGAGNSSELVKRFEVDKTPPKVVLAAPLAGSFLSARQGPVQVAGTVAESNLERVELRFGQGTPDASWPLLASGAAPAAPLVHAWDVSQVPDGAYNLVLAAVDRAGQSGSASVGVTVDNTPPRASITAPKQGAYVLRAGIVSGVAFDANLQEYTIEIAPGTGAAATRWSLLGTATTAVEAGTLLDWQALPVDGSYTLRLKVLDKAGAVAQATTAVVVDTRAPAAPLALVAKLENRNDARLTWNASPEPDLAGYALFRNGTRINGALLTQTSYADPALANASYSYEVKAVDKAGWESAASNVASVAVDARGPTARIVNPAQGALVSSLVDIRGVANAAVDFKEYRLYIGAGENPSAWRLLRRSPAPVRSDTLSSWDTVGLAENTVQSLKLEADDIYGGSATDIVTVTVDNTPPPAPLQLTAVANGADVTLRWSASAAPDLAGYIVLRDERIANASGPVVGSWKPYLVTTATHLDLQVADGQHRYTVMAMDRAENMSAPSNTASVTIDTRAPHAVLMQPLANAHIGRSTYLLATTLDTDVATVQFQYRPDGSPEWIDIGAAATALPYAATLDGAAFTEGDYQLRALATDIGGRTDPAPAPIKVTFSETPDVITDLKASVNGGDVTLTWSSAAAGLSGYVLERYNAQGGVDRIDVAAQAVARYVDSALPDFRYRYRVSAVGASGRPNMSSDDVVALVHTPRFAVPFTPTALPVLKLSGKAESAGTMTLATDASGGVAERRFATDADGNFVQADIAVPMGASRYALRHSDAAGNISKPVIFEMQRGTPPATPAGLAARLQDGVLDASWDANSEPDLFGYRVVRNSMPVTAYAQTWFAEASSSAPGSDPSSAIDQWEDSWWSPDTTVKGVEQTLTVQFQEPALVTDVAVTWNADGVAADYDLQIPAGAGNWATLAAVRGNGATQRVHAVPQVVVSQLRIKLFEQGTVPQLAELQAFGPVLQADTALMEPSTETTETLQVHAVNVLGMESAPAQATAGPDAVPAELPDLAVEAAGIVAESDNYRAGDAVRLSAVLANTGAGSARNVGAVMTVTDARGQPVELNAVSIEEIGAGATDMLYGAWTPEAAGEYTVAVVLDAANTVIEANEANNRAAITLVVLPASAGAAIPLTVTAPPQGSVLDLAWTAPAGTVASFYRIRSAPAADGPYTVLADYLDATDWLDETVTNGVRRFYIVSAFDDTGHMVGNSVPTSGVAEDTAVPAVPVLLVPTRSGTPVTVTLEKVDIGGTAAPGASVELVRAGAVVDVATASLALLRSAVADVGYNGYALADDASVLAAAGSIVDIASGVARAVPELQDANALRWSHRGGLLGVASYDSDAMALTLRVYSNAEQAFVQAVPLASVQPGFAWSHDDRQIAVAGRSPAGVEGLWLFDRVTGGERLLLEERSWSFNGSPSWTPDGRYLALVRNGIVEVLDTRDGSSVFNAAQSSAYPSWSADGKRLIYEVGDAWSTRSIGTYTLADNSTRLLTDGTADASMPLWAGPDGEFIAAEGRQAVLRGADGAFKAILVDEYYDGGQATTSGVLWYNDGSTLYRASAPGTFSFAKVRLNAGANLFAARAKTQTTNGAGKTSALSPAISITLAAGAQPDLAAAIDDLTVLPAAPLRGEATRITAMVRNRGGAAAVNVSASLALRGPDGVVTPLAATTIASLGAGASEALAADWTPLEAGQYSLVLALDAGDTVRESNEGNNFVTRTVAVAGSALPALNVTLDAAVYGANGPVAGRVTLSNAGPQVDGTLALRIEDTGGYLVAELPPATVTLPYGQSASYPANWNTGAILAGTYRLVAQLHDARGVTLAAGNAEFRIAAARDVAATVAVAFATYQQHASAAIGATVTLAQGNAGLDDASALIQVVDSADKVMFETVEALGNLVPGTSANVNTIWNVGASAIGDYRVKLAVRAGSATVATALAPVAVVAAAPASGTLQLSGALVLGSPTVAMGDNLDAAYTVRNDGTPLAGVALTVTVIDLETQAPLASFSTRADLARGAAVQGSAPFTVAAWPLKTVQVVFAAEIEGRQVVLQRATLRVIDRTPPVAAFVLAAQSGTLVAGGAMPVIVKATDSQSLVTRVEYAFGTSAWTPFALESRINALYRMSLAGIPDGPLQIQARAYDAANNESALVNLYLTVDNTPPLIQVAGVADGERYPDAVTPVVTVQDAHLKSTVITLDGTPFVSGTPVTAGGAHTLQVDAIDLAGNASARSIGFGIAAAAPPVLALTAPAPGALLHTPFTLAATASSTGSTIASVDYQFDGGAWLPTTAASAGQFQGTVAALADGRHKLAARAIDAAQQATILPAIEIDIDNTAPLIDIGGVVEGASYAGSATPVIDVSDAHPDPKQVSITLDATSGASRAFVSGQPVTAIGSHVLAVSATDQLGNKAEKTLRFTITPLLAGSLAVAPKPVAIGEPLLLTAMVGNGGGTALAAVQYRIAIVDAASGKVVQQFDDSGALAAGASWQRGFNWTAAGIAGTVLRATLTATVGTDTRDIGSESFTLAEAPVRLSGAVTVAPKEVEAGAVLAISRKLVNSGMALGGIALQLTIVDQQTGAVVFTHAENVDLAAHAGWSADLGWTASGAAGTGYLAKLTATVAGKAIAIGQDSFVVTAPASRLDIAFGVFDKQRILVLSQCKRSQSAGLGTCGVTPIVVDDAASLARCDSARAVAVARYLGQIGVSHKVVTTEADFAREIKAGGYTGYWISGGGTKLRQPLHAELNAGLQLGESLLADGMHDLRGSDRALQELLSVYVSGPEHGADGRAKWSFGTPVGKWLREFLGVYTNGSKPGEGRGTLRTSGELYPVNEFDTWGDKLQVDAFDTARVEAVIRSAGGDDDHHHAHGLLHRHHDGHGFHHGSDDIHRNCDPETSSRTGIVSGTFGAGRTLYFGFDWVASLQAGAANARWLDLGRSSFAWLRAAEPEAGTALVAGDVVARKIALHNTGQALAVQVVAQLPRGAKALVADPAAKTTDSAGGVTVTWQVNLAAGEARDLTLQLKLPLAAGTHDLRYTVSDAGKAGTVLGGDTVQLQVDGVAEWAAAQEATRSLDVSGANAAARDDVLRWTGKALASSQAGNDAKALRELVMAQSRLDNIAATPLAAAQQALARMIRALERRQ